MICFLVDNAILSGYLVLPNQRIHETNHKPHHLTTQTTTTMSTTIINYTSYVISAIFIILMIYTFTNNPIKKYKAKRQQNKYLQAVKENKRKKLLRYTYAKGAIEIWAKNSQEADKQYRQLLTKINA